MAIPLRWIVIAVFVLSSALNYLDRQLLAAVAPQLIAEFHLSREEYGLLVTAFSVSYAIVAPFAGLFIDRAGLNIGIGVSVACWSVASISTGFASSFGGVLGTRAALGAAEAGGIPGAGKANGTYLKSHELALGTAVNQVGLTIGGVAAPLLVGFLAAAHGWRSVFVLCGGLGLVWIPLWRWTASRVPERQRNAGSFDISVREMLADRRFWGLVIANLLYMTMYTLWTNWTTLYLVEAHGLTQAVANRQLAWIPPVCATLGGFAGGAMAFRLIRAGVPVFQARMRVCLVSATLLLTTAAVPLMPSPAWATAAAGFSYFWVLAMSTNVYVMPIDFFGPARAAFGVAGLTVAYGVMQAVVSPAIGLMIHRAGWPMVFFSLAPLPLVAVAVLKGFCDGHPERRA